jgi:hypothetical protein
MPMIVDPSAPQITPPATIVSPEGWLKAVVDEQWAGVLLAYNADTPPAARNLALNPSVAEGLGDTQTYNQATRAWTGTDSHFGTGSVQCTLKGTDSGGTTWSIPTVDTAGTVVRVSVSVKVPPGLTRVFLMWRSATGTLDTLTVPIPPAGQWARVSGSLTLTAGQVCTRAGVAAEGTAGLVFLADAAMIEVGDTSHDYIDGTLPGCAWEGAAHASPSIRVTAAPNAADILKVRITRQDPGAGAPVPVRSGDLAWAVEGTGQAYDHEAPLGVAVAYTATPQYADGTWGPPTSLGLVVPAPAPAQTKDLWLKSVEEPGLSMRVMHGPPQGTTSSGRQETAARSGSPYTAVAWDTASAPAEPVTVDVLAEDIEQFRRLIRTGVLLAQVRPGYRVPDRYFVPGDVTEKPTGKLGVTGGYTVTFDITPMERPDTVGQPMMMPGWTYDDVAEAFASYDAVTATYPTYAALATNGAIS